MKYIISRNIRVRVPKHFKVGRNAIIDDFCYFSTQVNIGQYSHIASNCTIAGGKKFLFTLGDFCSISSGVRIYCSSNDFVNDLIIPNQDIDFGAVNCEGNVTIGKYSGIGCNVVIMPNNFIPEGVAIGGMSWIPANYKYFEKWSVYAGIGKDFRKVKDRNKNRILQQVEILKNEKH